MATFVDIATLTDVSTSFPNDSWMQVSATQKVNITKLYNNASFVSGLKPKLSIPNVLSTKLTGMIPALGNISTSDTILQAINKVAVTVNGGPVLKNITYMNSSSIPSTVVLPINVLTARNFLLELIFPTRQYTVKIDFTNIFDTLEPNHGIDGLIMLHPGCKCVIQLQGIFSGTPIYLSDGTQELMATASSLGGKCIAYQAWALEDGSFRIFLNGSKYEYSVY